MPREQSSVIEVAVQAHPRSSRTALNFVGDVLHAWVTAPPVEGAANEAVIALIADHLGIARSRVTLVRGSTARQKRIAIAGVTRDDLRAKIKGREHEGHEKSTKRTKDH
jgi:uncharacterized protein YggU (UPF0235/DUF167 family)